MTFGIHTEVWVIVGLVVLITMFLMSFLARLYARRARTKRSSFTDSGGPGW